MTSQRTTENGWSMLLFSTADVGGIEDLPDRPIYAHDHAALLEQCQSALASRQASYPDLIARRLIDVDDARADIAAWELLVAEWTWIVGGTGQLPPSYTIADRIMAVELSLDRISQRMAQGARGHDLYRQAHLVQALRWHLNCREGGVPAVHRTAQITHEARALHGAKTSAIEAPQTERKAA
jgi:hypothetical protein